MGGLLIADAVTRIVQGTREKDPLWPNVVATIAYDTPVSLNAFVGADDSTSDYTLYATITTDDS